MHWKVPSEACAKAIKASLEKLAGHGLTSVHQHQLVIVGGGVLYSLHQFLANVDLTM
jgi:hypothetical protein